MSKKPVSKHFTGEWLKSESHPQIGTIEIRAPSVLLRLLAGWLEDDLRIYYVEPAIAEIDNLSSKLAARDAIIAEMTETIADLRSELAAAEYNIGAKGELLDNVMSAMSPAMSPTMQDEVRWPRPRPMAADCGPCELCARLDCVLNPKIGVIGHA